jgi:hypothetical protein
MKRLIIIAFIPMLLICTSVIAQTPVPESDTVSNPIREGDPAIHTLPPRMDYIENKKRITPEEIPQPVRQTLESDVQYQDWQKAAIFHEENKDEYIVEFKQGDKTTAYRFNKEGAPIIEE